MYLARGDLAFAWLRPVHEESWHWRGGMPVSWRWDEASLTTPAEASAEEFIAADCLSMNTGADGFILSQFARSKLEPLLSAAGEFWPVRVLGYQYWWFNCLACVDALDRRRTDADWDAVEGDWGSFRWITTTRRLAFRASGLRAAPALFRVPEYPQGVLFGTGALAQAVEQHRLTGFRFDMVWSSEGGGVSDPPGVGFGGVFEQTSPAEIEGKRAQARAVLKGRDSASGGEQPA